MDKLSTNGSMIEQLDLSRVPRSGFDMAFHNYLTGRLGAIIPTAVKEVLPGDRIKGSTHIVTNFEPLVSPLMANMVQKEEDFFIPYSVIWDKSHRFFTGKKGFDSSMPSNSYSIIFRVCPASVVFTYISDFLDNLLNDDDQLFQSIYDNIDSYLSRVDWISTYQCEDLFIPFKRRLEININALKNRFGDTISQQEMNQNHEEFARLFSILAKDVIDFWFGPSSLLDYLGCGYVSFDEKRSYVGPTGTAEDIMQLNLYDYINIVAQLPEDFTLDNGSITDLETFVRVGIFNKYFNVPINWMPIRAAYWVWYWNYRDQLIETNALDPEENMFTSTISSDEINVCLLLRQRCWMKDTFTTALTNTGDGNVIIPTTESSVEIEYDEDVKLDNTADASSSTAAQNNVRFIKVGDVRYSVPSIYLNRTSGNVGETTINSGVSLQMLDRARRLSSWLSKRLVLGTEYDDVVYSSFMVKLSNVRMRIPELLSAGRTTVNINVVVNNTNIPEGDVAGNKSAIAYADNIDDLSGLNYYAEEHGLLISFMSIMPIQSYPAQVQRLYFKRNRFDFAWPEFAQLGMDAVYLSELNGARGLNDETALTVFGYQGRYYDYKCNQDEEHGRLHTDLNYLTFGRVWSDNELPKLNPEFIHCWPRTDMFVMDENRDLFRSDVHHRWAMERCLPVPSDVLR